MKKVFGFLHLWLGLFTGLIVFIVSLTGCLYVFHEEITDYVYRNQLVIAPESRPMLTPGQLQAAVLNRYPEAKLQRIQWTHQPDRAVEITVKGDRLITVNPYNGSITGERDLDGNFFEVVEKIHRTLMLGEVGKRIVGVSVLMYLFLLVSGLILWWPRYKAALKQKFSIKWAARWRRVNYDVHSVGGFYALPILLVIAVTGLVWSFEWWENGLYRLVGSSPRDRSKVTSTYLPQPSPYPVDRIYARTLALEPGAEESFLIFPSDSAGVFRVQVRYDKAAFYRKYNNLSFDQYTGEILREKRYRDFSTGDVMRGANYDLHTGAILGLPGKILAFLASLFSASLPITGFLVWRGRQKKACKTIEQQARKARRTKVARRSVPQA